MGTPTRLAGALRSLILPGWGQWTQGRRALGVLLVVTVSFPLVAVGWVAITDAMSAASWLLRPDALLGLLLVNVFLLGIRTWSVWDAWAGGTPTRRSGWLVAVLVVAALPHLGVGWLQLRTIQALETVFAAPIAVAAATTTTPVSAPVTDGAPAMTAPTPSDAVVTTAAPPPNTTIPLPPWGEHLTVLLLGGDGAPDRSGIRTDAMLIMNVTTATGDLALFSLPRNLRAFPFVEVPEFDGILNAVYLEGQALPAEFAGPDPGAAAIMSVAEQITGTDIDYFAMLDFYAFVSVVDAVGGVTVRVPHEILFPEYRLEDGTYISITIEPGIRDLNGDEALAFVRSRKTGSDYGRMERQRCLVSALIAQADMPSLLIGLPGLISTFEDRVTTDIPIDVLPAMLTLVSDTNIGDAAVATFGPPLWHRGWVPGGWPVPDVEKIQAAVREVLAGDVTVLGDERIASAGGACGLPEG